MNSEVIVSESADNLLSGFAAALKDSLDRLGFPLAPERVLKLKDLFSLSKPQTYRIMTGKAAPTLASLVQLRSINISIDAILNQLQGTVDGQIEPERDHEFVCAVDISGVTVQCALTQAPPSSCATVMAVPRDGNVWNLVPINFGDEAQKGAFLVREIRFLDSRPIVAVVDDHLPTLKVICKQLEAYFRTVPFSEGSSLLKTPAGDYDAFVIDWRLPGISGEELVTSLRATSQAPIFVITGEYSFSHEIAKVIADADVHYVNKPVNEIILAAQISHAIRRQASSKRVMVAD